MLSAYPKPSAALASPYFHFWSRCTSCFFTLNMRFFLQEGSTDNEKAGSEKEGSDDDDDDDDDDNDDDSDDNKKKSESEKGSTDESD